MLLDDTPMYQPPITAKQARKRYRRDVRMVERLAGPQRDYDSALEDLRWYTARAYVHRSLRQWCTGMAYQDICIDRICDRFRKELSALDEPPQPPQRP